MAVFATVMFIVFGSVGAWIAWGIISFGVEAVSHKPKNVVAHKYNDGDEYSDQFYVQMPDGSVRID